MSMDEKKKPGAGERNNIRSASARREYICRKLNSASSPVSASRLAELCHVSRQIVVGDIALLRAAGKDIVATPRGYLIPSAARQHDILHTIAVSHRSDQMQEEMNIMVDNGCTIENVIVEHPVYGQLIGQLNCSSRHDVQEFINKVNQYHAAPLSELTDGLHLHTLRCPDEEAFERVKKELKEHGFLYEDGM